MQQNANTNIAVTRSGGSLGAPTPVPFYHHDLGQAELDSIAEVLKGPILTTGETVARFEERFAQLVRSRHALGVTSCTGALHMSLLALGIGEGDEVITTPMTFIATATSILEAGARPVFVDVEPDTGNIDVEKIEAAVNERTRAIMPVHLYGQMCDMRKIRAIADRHSLKIVEDAAHCVEGVRDGIRPGQLSDTACFSFYATKNLTCGEGGAVTANDDELAARLKLLRTHGMNKTAADRQKEGYQHWDMVTFGWKYNMDNIQAALLLPQMDRLAQKYDDRTQLAAYYEDLMGDVAGIRRPATLAGVHHAWHLFTVLINNGKRDMVINGLQRRGISVMVNYRPVHLTSYFQSQFNHREGDFPEAERFGEAILSLPFYPGMPKDHIEVVVNALKELLQ